MTKKTAQTELDEYIFTRPEMAKMLNISTNALRMRMRKGKCDLEYRFDGKQFKFKRPVRDRVNTMIKDQVQTTSKKIINRGATHKGQGKYPNEAFKQHNEMKILNSIQGKFKSEAHRREFEKLNEESLIQIDKNIRKEENKRIDQQYSNPGKYGGLLKGSTAKMIIDDKFHGKKFRQWKAETEKTSSIDTTTKFGNFQGYEPSPIDDGSVEVDPRDFSPDDREPEFSSKVQESIWRLKNKK